MNKEFIIGELRTLEQELQRDLTDIQAAIRILDRSVQPEVKAIKIPERPCVHCGKMFQPTYYTNNLCSDECKKAHTVKKKSELKQKTSVRRLKEDQPIPHPWNVKPEKMSHNEQFDHDLQMMYFAPNLKD